jgi:hypothetical protein
MRILWKDKKFSMPSLKKILTAAAVLGFLWIAPIYAQEAVTIRVQPALIEETVEPGKIYNFVLKISNPNAASEKFYLKKRDIKGATEAGVPTFANPGELTGYEVASWVNLAQDSVEISGGQTAEVPFTIAVPENASPGGHFGGILVSREPDRPETIGAGVGYEIGTILNLRVAGEAIEDIEIVEFKTDKSIYERAAVTFSVKIKNRGNVLQRPRGPIEIFDMFNKKVGAVVINEEGAGIFPRGEREFSVKWEEKGVFIGRFQAIMGLNFGTAGKQGITSVLSFWIIPFRLLGAVLGGILALIGLIYLIIRLQVRRKIKNLREELKRSGAPTQEFVYQPKHPLPSRLLLVAIALLLFTLLFLLVIFFLFA